MMTPYRNQRLFSNHYLQEILPAEREFQIDISGVKEVYQKIEALWDKNRFSSLNEPQLRKHFLDKVFEYLGWAADVEPPTPVGEARHPDYALFSSEEKLKLAQKAQREEYFKYAPCLAEAKRWGRDLDKKIKADPEDIQNPSLQMSNYLWLTEVKWGILTNGRYWRLYERETSKRLDIFYEIDLEDLLENGTAEDFKYFYLFFRKDAFPIFIEKVYKESKDYAEAVGEELKENVYQSLKILAQGFLEFPQNNLSPIYLKEIHDNSLIFLYRLLFIFYAEYSQLLPLGENQIYTDSYSLDAIKKEIADKLDNNRPIAASTHAYWNRLKDLFEIINNGNEELGVPPYNGGLFDAKKHDFLEVYKVGDVYIAKVIDLISRSKDKAFIDYSSLDIRHLGSIYEGLLEYKVTVAEEDLVPTKEKGKEIFIPLTQAKKQGKKIDVKEIVHASDVYLVTDKGERKATGSYYTPDYIVKYIIENTLGPIVKRIYEECHLVKSIKEKIMPLEKILETLIQEKDETEKANLKMLWNLTRNDKEQQDFLLNLLEGAQPKHGYDPVERIPQLKVLDPAMGSGHFLVEATDYLARELLRALSGEVEAEFIEKETKGVKEPPLQYETKFEEEDIRWARREIVERCIFGVDLNPLAVELAKLSLWLYTVSKNRPLNFLDHHLRGGNSLIGAKIDDLAISPSLKKKKQETSKSRQLTLFESAFREKIDVLLSALSQIEALPSDTVEQIREKEELYQKFRKIVAKFQDVADVWTSAYFGNEASLADHEQLHNNLRGTDEEWGALKEKSWFKKAKGITEKKHFFHWELEFPEVFFEGDKRKENPGFDAVVGNPPYVRQEQLGENKVFFQEKYEAYHSVADLYVYFFEQSHKVLRNDGLFGFISSNKFLRSNYGKALRQFLSNTAWMKAIIDFGELPVFEESATFPAIFLTEKAKAQLDTLYVPIPTLDFGSLNEMVDRLGFNISSDMFAGEEWFIMEKRQSEILRKMEKIGLPLGDYVGRQIKFGIKTGFNKAFIIDEEVKKQLIAEDPRSIEIIKPLIVGDDARRYEIRFRERYLIWTYIGVPIEKYPAVLNHLEQYRLQLEKRWDKGDQWYELRHCGYYADFEKPKIVYPDIGMKPRFCLDNENIFVEATAFIIPKNDKYLLSLLNSKLLFEYIKSKTPVLGDVSKRGRVRFKTVYLNRVPIRRISFTTSKEKRKELLEEGGILYQTYITTKDYHPILKFIEQRLSAEPEQSDVVHDILAFLAEQIIKMNKEKQSEIKGFLEWLESYIGVKVDQLKRKTKIRSYFTSSWKDFLEVLKHNKSKIQRLDIARREPQDKIKAEYEISQAKLLPLLLRIESTDNLIDQIVYKLYGLTEEEIKIIEGR